LNGFSEDKIRKNFWISRSMVFKDSSIQDKSLYVKDKVEINIKLIFFAILHELNKQRNNRSEEL